MIFSAASTASAACTTNPNAYACLLSVQACGGVVQLVRARSGFHLRRLQAETAPGGLPFASKTRKDGPPKGVFRN